MAAAFALLIACQLIGELLRAALHLPLPGPVIGMLLLTGLLVRRSVAPEAPLGRVADGLIGNMGLLFVPAGVGIIAQFGLLQQDWLPILAGLVVSTVSGLVVTGLVMHRVSQARERLAPAPASPAVGAR